MYYLGNVNWKMCIIRERGVRIPFQSIHSKGHKSNSPY